MKKKQVKKVEVKAPEVKAPEVKAPEITTTTDRREVDTLQKQGFVVTDVLSEVKGIRSKTWVLRKEQTWLTI